MSEEQQNLSRRERRAQAKTGSTDGDGAENVKDRNQKLRVDAAAKRRKSREAERYAAATEGLATGERVDDALVRGSAATSSFIRKNFVWLQWIVIAGFAGAMGYLVFNYRKQVGYEKQGQIVAAVLGEQFAKIASSEPLQPSDPRLLDPRKEYSSNEEKAGKLGASWARLSKAKSLELRLIGKLGQAGALYEEEKYSDARALYEKAVAAPQASLHPVLKGRALEGLALSLEADKKFDAAIQAFDKMKALKLPEFTRLATFHVARVEYVNGDKKRALEMLTTLDAELSKGAGPEGPTDYLGAAVRDLLKTVDPARAAAEQKAISAAQMEKLMKQFQEMQKSKGPALPPSLGGSPPPAPAFPQIPRPTPDVEKSSPTSPIPSSPSAKSKDVASKKVQVQGSVTPKPTTPNLPAKVSPAAAPVKVKTPATVSTPVKAKAPAKKATPTDSP